MVVQDSLSKKHMNTSEQKGLDYILDNLITCDYRGKSEKSKCLIDLLESVSIDPILIETIKQKIKQKS